MRLLVLAAALQVPAPPNGPRDVEVVLDLAYYEGKDADPKRHTLDFYRPKGETDFPVLMFAHGGGWKSGGKEQFEFLGRSLARGGIGVAAVNYRLHPAVSFPANVEDVARAFAWVRTNAARYGGRTDALFVGGHSAGGHLVSLLAADASYLKAVKLSPGDVKGVVSISGLYAIPRGRFPLFENSDEGAKKASPVHHAKEGLPPFLLVYADGDFPRFGDMAEDFAKALKAAKCDAECLKQSDRTHGSVAAKMADDDDPVRRAVLAFVAKHARAKGKP
jgi:acetyl esterase/lipase